MIESIYIIIKKRGPVYDLLMESGEFYTEFQVSKSTESLKTFASNDKAQAHRDEMVHGVAKHCEIVVFDRRNPKERSA